MRSACAPTDARRRCAASRCCRSSASSAATWPGRDGRTTARADDVGHELREGLRESDRLPDPIFTPATKAQEGHDENIGRDEAAELVGRDLLEEVERVSLALYRFGRDHAAARGIILADTKFEFGLDPDGTLVLGDEALTPDSSRFWPADEYEPGRAQPSFDKQYVRDYCESLGWDKAPPAPELPPDVVHGTRARYVEAFERLTGIGFEEYLENPDAVLS
jgi:phosphoribosylaminoimidazole-succinocarboxamide synthase